MRRSVIGVLCLLAAGCASPGRTTGGYYSVYSLGTADGRQLSEREAEEAHRDAINARQIGGDQKFDSPVRMLFAPQPVMPPEDTEAAVVGRVTVRITFGEDGAVEQTQILESTKQSLSEAVLAAVSRWKVAPLTSEGKPAKLVARQTFSFRTAP
jgi:TonB family protein